MDFIELKALTRTETGNGPARRLRTAGQIPAVFYGPGTAPVLLTVNTNDFDQAMKKSSAGQFILNLIIQNSETDTKSAMVMIKELQVHPVSRNYQHVDFYEIAMDRKVKVKVPVVTTGKPKGVELGGILQIIRRELEILCLPLKVPESIEIDISDLDMGDAVHIEDISLEGDIEFLDDTNVTVVTMLSPKLEEEPVDEEEKIEEEGDEEEEEAPETGEKE